MKDHESEALKRHGAKVKYINPLFDNQIDIDDVIRGAAQDQDGREALSRINQHAATMSITENAPPES